MRNLLLLATLFSVVAVAQDPWDLLAQAPPLPPAPAPVPSPAPAPTPPIPPRGFMNEDAYRAGTRAIDRRQYEEAIRYFSDVIGSKSRQADGALYWKAYAQNRLGHRTEAQATLAQLGEQYPQSRWLNDAKALEIEVRQASGQPVSPDAESDEDLKLLAINGLMTSDPERALPLLKKVLADPKASPRVKERALFVVAQSHDQAARDVLVQIAKGGGNPDMQMKAVEYLGMFSRGNGQALAEIYNATSDPAIKRAVIHGLMMGGDFDGVLNLAKTEKSPELRKEAIRTLGMMRRDKSAEALLSMYASETDPSVKKAIIDGLFMQGNATALIDLARKERDMSLKKDIVQRLALMKNKEATDYMMEILNK